MQERTMTLVASSTQISSKNANHPLIHYTKKYKASPLRREAHQLAMHREPAQRACTEILRKEPAQRACTDTLHPCNARYDNQNCNLVPAYLEFGFCKTEYARSYYIYCACHTSQYTPYHSIHPTRVLARVLELWNTGCGI